jgi:hypothetical protein
MPEDQPSGVARATIDASGGQGVVVGTGNVQNNTWSLKPPLNPATLAALSPHAAVARIRQLSHDDAVDLFASASPEDLPGKLKALLIADEAKAVSILADLDPGKAAEIISPHARDFPWLATLPEAAEAIAQCAVDGKWDREAGTGKLERAAQSPAGTGGYFRRYAQGRIYWRSDDGDAYAVRGSIAEFHLAGGGTSGELGFPMDDPYFYGKYHGADTIKQIFENGRVYTSSHGTYRVPPELDNVHDGWLGFPVSAVEIGDGGESRQRFEAGIIVSSEAGAFAVRPEVAERAGHEWVPISAEVGHSYRTARVQRFRRADDQMAVYSSGDTGARRVTGRVLALYEELGGPDSELGLPLSSTFRIREGGWSQRFEHGTIYDRPGHELVAVPAETAELVGGVLGWPVSGEKPVDASEGETIQYFEKGVVTLRNGVREIWLRPAPGWEQP